MGRAGSLSRGLVLGGRLVAAVGVVTAIGAAVLMFSGVDAGSMSCGNLTEVKTWEYATKQRPLPAVLAPCEPALTERAAVFVATAKAAGALLAGAAAAAMSGRVVQRVETFVVAASRQRRRRQPRLGAQANVVSPSSMHRGNTGRIVGLLPGDDEFDLVVTFDEPTGEIYAFKLDELKLVGVATHKSRPSTRLSTHDATMALLPI